MINLAFRDIFVAIAMVFLLVALLPHKQADEADGKIQAQGQLAVTLVWPPGVDRDIDLWVKRPGSEFVGWSKKGDRVCDLLRDDLGARDAIDPVQINFEQAQCRKLEAGEYVIIAHFFGGNGDEVNVPVTVEVKMLGGAQFTDVYSTVLEQPGSYAVMSRFVLDEEGYIVVPFNRQPFNAFFATGDREAL